MSNKVKCFVCLGENSDLLSDYDLYCNICGADCGTVLDAAWDTIEQLDSERKSLGIALEKMSARADNLRYSLNPNDVDEGRCLERFVEGVRAEIQAATQEGQE